MIKTESSIAIVRLGYVGWPLAVEFGKHRPTVGFDINVDRIGELQAGQNRSRETESVELTQATQLTYTTDLEALRATQVYIVTVPTPINTHKRTDLASLLKAAETVGKVLKKGDIVAYVLTVYCGTAEKNCVPVLECVSGLIFNRDFFCGYSPERINPDDKLHRLIETYDMMIIAAAHETFRERGASSPRNLTRGTRVFSDLRL